MLQRKTFRNLIVMNCYCYQKMFSLKSEFKQKLNFKVVAHCIIEEDISRVIFRTLFKSFNKNSFRHYERQIPYYNKVFYVFAQFVLEQVINS